MMTMVVKLTTTIVYSVYIILVCIRRTSRTGIHTEEAALGSELGHLRHRPMTDSDPEPET